jgi:hypothetical protein
MRNLLFCFFLLCLTACSQKALIDRLASPEEQRQAIETAQELRAGDVASVAQRAGPELKGQLSTGIAQVQPILEQAKGPFSIETVRTREQNGGPVTKAFTVEAGSNSHWAAIEIVFEDRPRSSKLVGFHAFATNSDPAKLNDFNISQRGLLGYVWLLLMSGCVTLCITAVVLIWRRPWLKRRWLWTLGSLFGFVGFGLNWSNGILALLFVNVSFLGATATRAGPFAPWILTFGIPVIAIIVIVRWFREVRQNTAAG